MIDYQLNVKPGDVLEDLKFGRMRPGHFIIGGSKMKELSKQRDEILGKVGVTFE